MSGFLFTTGSTPMFFAQVRQPVTLVGRRPAPTPEGQSFLLPSVVGGLCVAALAVIAVRAWRRRGVTPGRRALLLLARSLRLSASERALIESIGSPEPAAVLLSEHAFRAAVERWVDSDPPESARRRIAALASRLGWAVPELVRTETAINESRPPVRPTLRPRPVAADRVRLVA